MLLFVGKSAQISFAKLFFFQVGIVALITLCDKITKEFDKFILVSYKLENCELDLIIDKNEMRKFIKNVSQNRPKFTAGRYFTVEMSSIFSIFDSMTTFLLIIIQFKAN